MLPKAVRQLAQELSRLPGIGPKSAERLSLHILRQPRAVVEQLSQTLSSLHAAVHLCQQCYNLADAETCSICSDSSRDATTLCVVEDALAVESLEKADSYRGLYHVLGGTLSPLEGVGPDDIRLKELLARFSNSAITEVIIALDHTMEAEATVRHITANLARSDLTVTRLARGLPTGGDIEFADAQTVAAALKGRTPLSVSSS